MELLLCCLAITLYVTTYRGNFIKLKHTSFLLLFLWGCLLAPLWLRFLLLGQLPKRLGPLGRRLGVGAGAALGHVPG